MPIDRRSVALVKLNGTLIKKNGEEKPSNYFDFLQLNSDDYSDISFTPEEAARVKRHMQSQVTGSTSALPMICGGPACCFIADRCPYVRVDRERKKQKELQDALHDIDVIDKRFENTSETLKPVCPIGRGCLVEIDLINEWTALFINEYEINPSNFTEFQMVRELAEVELLLWRLNNNLAKPENAELVQETTVGIDKQGNVLTRKEVSSIFEARERLQNRKSRLVKLMVGDRQEKYKREAALKQKQEGDPSVSAARLRASIDRLTNQAKLLEVKASKLDGEAIEVSSTDNSPENDTLTPDDIINSND